MFESTIVPAAAAAGTAEAVERARLLLAREGCAAFETALAPFAGLAPDQLLPAHGLLVQAVAQLIAAFQDDSRAPTAYAALAVLPDSLAERMFDLTLEGMFGDRPRDITRLNEAGLLTLVGLLSAAGAHAQAATLLAEARRYGTSPGVAHAAWVARCRWAGCPSSLAAHQVPADLGFADIDAARARIDAAALDLAAHRALLRHMLASGDVDSAIQAVGIALALPLADGDKIDLAPELALLAARLAATGDLDALRADRTRWSLAAAPGVTAAAAARLEAGLADGSIAFLDPAEGEAAVTLLRDLAAPAAPITSYPMRGGKPHVDIVWLEITNHCNQKCTFCPDMFREDARTWLPLAQVKTLIDQLADTLSVGSMQLNAYGEPLLHPNIGEILAYIREKALPFPTFFTSHGMTLVDKKLKQLSHNYPAGIAISLHNDSQESYEATRSHKIGDYETLVARVTALIRQMAEERAPSHVRLYQMVSNGAVDLRVDAVTRGAFPETRERMLKHVRKWEAIAAGIAGALGPESGVEAHVNSEADIHRAFDEATHDDGNHLPILSWIDEKGLRQYTFMSARPVGTYANLLLEYDPRWAVERKLISTESCGFVAAPSLAIFATGRLGICCMDLNSTATFGSLSDFPDLRSALTSPQALQMFAQLSNGVAVSRGCQICLGGSERHCASKKLPGPARPAGHFRDGI